MSKIKLHITNETNDAVLFKLELNDPLSTITLHSVEIAGWSDVHWRDVLELGKRMSRFAEDILNLEPGDVCDKTFKKETNHIVHFGVIGFIVDNNITINDEQRAILDAALINFCARITVAEENLNQKVLELTPVGASENEILFKHIDNFLADRRARKISSPINLNIGLENLEIAGAFLPPRIIDKTPDPISIRATVSGFDRVDREAYFRVDGKKVVINFDVDKYLAQLAPLIVNGEKHEFTWKFIRDVNGELTKQLDSIGQNIVKESLFD
jgi:hypothetical protein